MTRPGKPTDKYPDRGIKAEKLSWLHASIVYYEYRLTHVYQQGSEDYLLCEDHIKALKLEKEGVEKE